MEKYDLSYYNLLIFTILSAIISIILIIVVYLQDYKKYIPFIATLIFGIFGIILYIIIKVYLNNLDYNNQILTFDKCPEYFNKKIIDGKEICTNDSIYYDENNNQFILKVYPVDNINKQFPLPSKLNLTYSQSDNKYEKFPLNEINNTASLNNNTKKCSTIYGTVTDPDLATFNQYALTPWTNFKSQCASVN